MELHAASQQKSELIFARGLTSDDVDERIDKGYYSEVWGDWVGREAEYYAHCYAVIQKIGTEEFGRITGIDQEVRIRDLIVSYQRMMHLPQRLRWNPNSGVVRVDDRLCSIRLDIPNIRINIAMAIVTHFSDYAPPVIEDVSKQNAMGLDKDPDIIRVLFHNGVLVEE